MKRFCFLILVLAFAVPLAFGQRIRLYLTDGSYHMVSKYEVLEDRVRYYSLERSEWEELPLKLVDLARTKADAERRRQELRREQESAEAEEAFFRAQRTLVQRIPRETGVYLVEQDEIRALVQAELAFKDSGGRMVLQRIVPIPVVAGKTSVEIEGEASSFVLANPQPEFFVRLEGQRDFGIVRLKPSKKGARIVETISSIRQIPELYEERELVEVFQHQLEPDLYKVWPVKPLPPGEYAVAQFIEGKGNIRAWDFSIQAPAATKP